MAYHGVGAPGLGGVDDVVLADVPLGGLPADPQGADGGVGHLQVLHSAQWLCNTDSGQHPGAPHTVHRM